MRLPALAALVLLAAPSVVAAADGCRVNLADYRALEKGDTLKTVVVRLGCKGRRRGGMTIGRRRRVTYSWRSPGRVGSNMLLTFRNGRLSDKSQLGLD